MAKRNQLVALLLVVLSAAMLGLGGCSSGDTDGGDAAEQDFVDTQFVASEEAVGGLTLSVATDTVAVGGTTTYTVSVRDATGKPVPQIRIACDTERGLALIEPTTGVELTDPFGNMSGVVGCEVPGSLQMACRLPIGANKRKFALIKCEGTVPDGFTGFAGAGGGGLFGGVSVEDDGSPGGGPVPDGISIDSINFIDVNGSATFSIDTLMDICDIEDDGTIVCEPFSDTTVTATITNSRAEAITIRELRYSVNNADGAGSQFNSKRISITGGTIEPGATVTISTLFAEAVANAAAGCGTGKRFADSGTVIPGSLGFRNITFRFTGTTAAGESFTLTARASGSFSNFSFCTS